jgi:adenylate kinase|tara:strand:- start:9399 stop:9983 length:585 start_codon:yes stop_codon:yes gene_type:complete
MGRSSFYIHEAGATTMSEIRAIAVSGTPGVGKTDLCAVLVRSGFTVLSLRDLAESLDCLGVEDPDDGASPIDIHALTDAWEFNGDEATAIDGHLSHLMDVDGIVLLRCAPSTLQQRLTERGYDEGKIRSNVEWEMTSGHWSELVEFEVETPILEVDTTSQSAEDVAAIVKAWLDAGCKSAPLEEAVRESIDWLS